MANGRIETQDVLFGQKNTKRVVEIGAANVLAVMAQRTLASKYEAHDAVHSIRRQILTWTEDAKEIFYEVEANDEPTKSTATPPIPVEKSANAVMPVEQASYAPSTPDRAVAIQDIPISPIDILRALIAQKLKKSLTEITPRLSIKELAGGGSRGRY